MPMTRWACVLTLMLLSPTWAQSPVASYPDKPARLVVPFTPGGSSDIVGRLVVHKGASRGGTGAPNVVDSGMRPPVTRRAAGAIEPRMRVDALEAAVEMMQ